MSDNFNQLPEPKLPFWMAGAELSKLGMAAHKFFAKLADWCVWPARQMDPLTASLPILDLIAWQRGIKRYDGEPERLYRLRVAYAYPNARDAGQVNGWKRIFNRLELGNIELEERVPGQDWDIVGIVVNDASFPDQQDVTEIIVDEYGRTCRRYRFVSRVVQAVTLGIISFDDDHCTVEAALGEAHRLDMAAGIGFFDNDFSLMEL